MWHVGFLNLKGNITWYTLNEISGLMKTLILSMCGRFGIKEWEGQRCTWVLSTACGRWWFTPPFHPPSLPLFFTTMAICWHLVSLHCPWTTYVSIWLRTIPNRLSIWDFGHLDHFVFLFQMQSDLTVIATGISILLQYLNHTLEPNDGDTWTISATRCENVEEILKGCCIILQCCGNTAYLSSVYKMWQITSNSLFLFEQRWWPEQRADTPLHIDTPPVALKLSALLRPGWREQARLLRLAMASLVILRDWIRDFFNTELHREPFSIVTDAVLIFQTACDLFDLHDAIPTDNPVPRDPPEEPLSGSTPSAGTWPCDVWHGDVALSHLWIWKWCNECLNWRPIWKLKTIFVNEIVWKLECQFWASLDGFRMSCPTWQKGEWTWCPLWDCICMCCFVLWCHLVFMFGLCCALYSPILVLAWRIHDISPCYGGLPPRLL